MSVRIGRRTSKPDGGPVWSRAAGVYHPADVFARPDRMSAGFWLRQREPLARAIGLDLTHAQTRYGEELEGILEEISTLEREGSVLEERLADPSLYGDPDAAKRVRADHEKTQRDLAQRIARWEELEARRDAKRS